VALVFVAHATAMLEAVVAVVDISGAVAAAIVLAPVHAIVKTYPRPLRVVIAAGARLLARERICNAMAFNLY
jgi:hypothetical protein